MNQRRQDPTQESEVSESDSDEEMEPRRPRIEELLPIPEMAVDDSRLPLIARQPQMPSHRAKRLLRNLMTWLEKRATHHKVPHDWLCSNILLCLTDPNHMGNYEIFQKIWKKGHPLVVTDVMSNLDLKLWNPSSFSDDFGEHKIDLVECVNGDVIRNQPMQLFWDGFKDRSKRPKDETGLPMILKMNWPPITNFGKVLPTHLHDLLKSLPLTAYTHPNGLLNFLNYLPKGFLTGDVGTRMLCAYGSALSSTVGTTNIRINQSDVAYIVVYVEPSQESDWIRNMKDVIQALHYGGCDFQNLRRLIHSPDTPGTLWHIFREDDKDKINDLLNTVSLERGIVPDPNSDPLKDGTWYLDDDMRSRLSKDYLVDSHAILQCLGDAVFIPAGTPYQARHLHSCISVVQDFVSLQNVKRLSNQEEAG